MLATKAEASQEKRNPKKQKLAVVEAAEPSRGVQVPVNGVKEVLISKCKKSFILPYDILLIIFSYISHDFESILALSKVNKQFFAVANLILYRFPRITSTFNWATLYVKLAVDTNPSSASSFLARESFQDRLNRQIKMGLSSQLLVLDFGSKRPADRIKTPCFHLYSDSSKNISFTRPMATFPYTNMVVGPASSRSSFGNMMSEALNDNTMLEELYQEISSLSVEFALDRLDAGMAAVVDTFLATKSTVYLQSIISCITKFEKYFCCVELIYNGSALSIDMWRNVLITLQLIPPTSFNLQFESEILENVLPKILDTSVSTSYSILKKLCAIVNKYRFGTRYMHDKHCICLSPVRRPDLEVYGSSIMKVSENSPFLQALILSSTDLKIDVLIKETGEFLSMIAHEIPSYFTRVPITPFNTLTAVFQNCLRLKYLDLSGCLWVDREIVLHIIAANPPSLVSVNFLFCMQLAPTTLAKLFVMDTHDELIQTLDSLANNISRNHHQYPIF